MKLKSVLLYSVILFVITFSSVSFGISDPCHCHTDARVKSDVQKDSDPQALAWVTLSEDITRPLSLAVDLGVRCYKKDTTVSFYLKVEDVDLHVCELGDNFVHAFMVRGTSTLKVRVWRGATEIDSVNFGQIQEDNVTFSATAVWSPPKDGDGNALPGQYIFFFEGDVQDKYEYKDDDNTTISVEHAADSLDGPADISGFAAVLTIVKVNLEYNSLKEETGDKPHEEDPGGLLGLNDNDNDGEAGVDKDRAWNPNQPTQPGELAVADPDLKILSMAIEPLLGEGTVTLTIPSGIRVWENNKKKSLITGPWNLAVTAQRDALQALLQNGVWLEGIATGSDNLNLSYVGGGETCEDKVRMTVIKVESIEGPEEVCKGDEKTYQIITAPPGHYDILTPSLVGCSGTWNPSTGVITVQFNLASTSEDDKKKIKVSCGSTDVVKEILVIDGKLDLSPVPNNVTVPNAFTPDVQALVNIVGTFFGLGNVDVLPKEVITQRWKVCCPDDGTVGDWMIQLHSINADVDLGLSFGTETLSGAINKIKAALMAAGISTVIVDAIGGALDSLGITIAGISGGYDANLYDPLRHLDECECGSDVQERWAGSETWHIAGQAGVFDPQSTYPEDWPGEAPPISLALLQADVEHRKYSGTSGGQAFVWTKWHSFIKTTWQIGTDDPQTHWWVNDTYGPILTSHAFCVAKPISQY